MTLTEKYLRFKEYLENGGINKIYSIDLLEDLKKVRIDNQKYVIPETVSSVVMAAFNAIASSHLQEPYISDTFIENYQSFNQKDLYFSQQRIDTENEFDRVYEENAKLSNTLFRGVSEAKWRLLNSLQRFWISNKYEDLNISYESFLDKLVGNARKMHNDSLIRYLKELKLDPKSDIAILSFLQHYGTSSFTPLLDWTYRFKNSLFFAIDNLNPYLEKKREIDNYFSVYYLNEENFDDGDLSKIVEKVLNEDYKNIFDKSTDSFEDISKETLEDFKKLMTENSKKLYVYQLEGRNAIRHITQIKSLINIPIAYFSDRKVSGPFKFSVQNNFNIINQEGAFVWNSSPLKPLEYVAKEEYLKEETGDYFFCHCLNINKKLKYYIKNRLDNDGITRDFIYPNPDDISNESFNITVDFYSP